MKLVSHLFVLVLVGKKEGLHADTLVDRRPVDPPPVVELLLDNACVP
jgi:hypothetical protein